jgi:hypothetical protein
MLKCFPLFSKPFWKLSLVYILLFLGYLKNRKNNFKLVLREVSQLFTLPCTWQYICLVMQAELFVCTSSDVMICNLMLCSFVKKDSMICYS